MSTDPGLAHERTALAWQRTGYSMLGLGAACLRLLPSTPARPVLGLAVVVAGAVVTVGGARLDPVVPHRRWLRFVAACTVVTAAAALVLSFG